MTRKNNLPLKYDPVSYSKVNEILTKYKNDPVIDYINDLYGLINYQRQLIADQEKKLIALKHTEAWKHYEKDIEKYNYKTRKYDE